VDFPLKKRWGGQDHGCWRVLDIRPETAFLAGHVPGAVSWPLAAPPPEGDSGPDGADVLPSIFLPPREVPLVVMADDQATADSWTSWLRQRGRPSVVAAVVGELPAGAPLEMGPSRARLWAPPPWLAAHQAILPPPAAGPVLDLACGSGRGAVWLAERGYRVTGIDWQPEALALGRQLASACGVQVRWVAGDLRQAATVPDGPWAVICNFRYLQRVLLARLPELLQPGGVALVRTFRHLPNYRGHPARRHRLERGELLRCWREAGCEILAHEESWDPDGRPAAGVVARRRCYR